MVNTWRTFCKARITCLGGSNDSPFIFNEISKIKIINKYFDNLLYLDAFVKPHGDRFIVSFTSLP